jgi:protein-tyrosine kinase
MSKIEKALHKARASASTKSGEVIRSQSLTDTKEVVSDASSLPERAAETGMPAAPTVPSSNLVEGGSGSAVTISFMHQPPVLDAQDRQMQKIIYPEAAENGTIMALREIRTKILQRTGSSNCVIMVTGTSLGSGATFVSVNLAAAFALDAARTVLAIDCNIRDPFLHRLISGEVKAGLTNFLTDSRSDIADIIQPTGITRLRVIPAGVNIDPAVEYFTMERMRRLIRSVRERYPDRNIILDCPPIARSADTQILQELCDYVVVVVPYARATPSMLHAALKHIKSAKLLGVILNEEPVLPEIDWKFSIVSVFIEMNRRVAQFISGWKAKAMTLIRKSD